MNAGTYMLPPNAGCDPNSQTGAAHVQSGSSLFYYTLLGTVTWTHPSVHFHGDAKLAKLTVKITHHTLSVPPPAPEAPSQVLPCTDLGVFFVQ